MLDEPPALRQLGLPFDEPDHFDAADLIEAPSNQAARTALMAPQSWVNNRLVLWGEAGCGKSHLAAVWAKTNKATMFGAARLYEPISSSEGPLVIEDIDMVAAPIALFATLELTGTRPQPILMTSRLPPARLPIDLPDLASRLRASLTIQIEPPESALLGDLLVRLAAARQMTLTNPLHQFLLNRLPRRPAVLREAIARLDRYSLALGTPPTRRIAERLIHELTDTEGSDTNMTENERKSEIHLLGTRSML